MSDRKPMVLVLAGPNGSGKSTITQYFDKVGTYTNADDVVAATGMNNQEAAEMVDRMRYASIEAAEDFTFETVLSSLFYMFMTTRLNQHVLYVNIKKTFLFFQMTCGLRKNLWN